MTFKKGQSGNPKGRKKGSTFTSRAATARKAMNEVLRREGPALIRLLVRQAKAEPGGPAHLALMERLVPKLRPEEAPKPLPISSQHTDADNRDAVVDAMASAALSIDEGARILTALSLEEPGGMPFNITINLGDDPAPQPAPLPMVEEVLHEMPLLPPDLRVAAGEPLFDPTRMHREQPSRRPLQATTEDDES